MSIEWRPLPSHEISLLQSPESLYVFDLRGTNVLASLKIPDFWKYENIFPWILQDQHVVVNEDYARIKYPNSNHYVVAYKHEDPRVSLMERLNSTAMRNFSAIWMGVPNSATDLLAQENNIPINFSFADFQNYNDKYKQKELFADITPDWQKVHSKSEVASYMQKDSQWFLKRRHGSGGWHILDLAFVTLTDLDLAFSRSTDWFIERKIEGNVYSVQCLRLPQENKTVIFGFVNQLIEEGTHFIGGSILPLSGIENVLQEQIEQAINKLESLLKSYEGFYGIDFIVTNTKKLYILEANVRMTAMTIPALVANDLNKHLDFLEDVEKNKIATNDLVISEDLVRMTADVLRTPKAIS